MKKLFGILLTGALLSTGCATGRELDALQTEYDALTQEHVELEGELVQSEHRFEYMCALHAEVLAMGMVEYLGEGRFFNKLSKEMIDFQDLPEECAKMVDEYERVVRTRNDKRATADTE